MEIALEIFSVLDEVEDSTTMGPLFYDVASKLSDETRTKFLQIITITPTPSDIASQDKAEVKEEEATKKKNVKTEVNNTSMDLSATLELLKAMGQNESGVTTRYFKKEFNIDSKE